MERHCTDDNSSVPWSELSPDVFERVFSKLPIEEKLTVIPRVCKSWSQAVMSPHSWEEMDTREWSRACRHEQLRCMVTLLISRSRGSFNTLCVAGLPNDEIFSPSSHNRNQCKLLTEFCSNKAYENTCCNRKRAHNEQAYAIAATMKTLKSLQICYLCAATRYF